MLLQNLFLVQTDAEDLNIMILINDTGYAVKSCYHIIHNFQQPAGKRDSAQQPRLMHGLLVEEKKTIIALPWPHRGSDSQQLLGENIIKMHFLLFLFFFENGITPVQWRHASCNAHVTMIIDGKQLAHIPHQIDFCFFP